LRMAQKAKSLNKDAEITVFYMDIQKFGKGFDDFFADCKKQMTFIRSRPYEIKQGQNDTVIVKFAPDAANQNKEASVSEKEFDLLVLSVGIRPGEDAGNLAEKLGVAIDEQGFFGFKNANCLPETQKEGIFTAGACESPKDIQASMAQAEAVCSLIIEN
jgi:heterodisulfide reductase subunit A2